MEFQKINNLKRIKTDFRLFAFFDDLILMNLVITPKYMMNQLKSFDSGV